MTNQPAYVSIAGEYARLIRSGSLAAGTHLPSTKDLAEQHGVSMIVVRKAVELLQNQGLVRTVERKGVYVADRPNLVRVSPERQMEDPEDTYASESDSDVRIERDSRQVPAGDDLAEIFRMAAGDPVTHTIVRASEGGRPISISDTYQPLDVTDASGATHLEETIADRLPFEAHAEWLRVNPGELVKTVHQRFVMEDGRVIMVSDVSYPKDRYDAFVFRMSLEPSV
jgi:GntR family transcriptional regulator